MSTDKASDLGSTAVSQSVPDSTTSVQLATTMLQQAASQVGAGVLHRKMIQRRRASSAAVQASGGGMMEGSDIHATAAKGVASGGGALPHGEQIQASFGAHDVSGIHAHVGGQAASAAEQIGAQAYATGDSVAFRSSPDLHTAAHEAAHVVQQRGGVQLKGGVGQEGDPFERHADAVADQVVAGKSAEALLSQHAAPAMGSSGTGGSVQRLALRYGDEQPIPADAQTLAAKQDTTRDTKKVIPVQTIDNGGGVVIDPQVFKNMAAREDIYLVAHGRAALGDEPAQLQAGRDGPTIGGSEVASVINTIHTGLKKEGKNAGDFKIEACMSALGRKTSRNIFERKKHSLVEDTQKSLLKTFKVKGVNVKGNKGLAEGSELDGGVKNTSFEGTELVLLDNIVTKLREAAPKQRGPMVKDGLAIVARQKKLLNGLKGKNKTLAQCVGKMTTSEYLKKAFLAMKAGKQEDDMLDGVIALLVSSGKETSK